MNIESIDHSRPGARSPATGEALSEVNATPIDAIAGIVEEAREAQTDWAKASLGLRSRMLLEAAEAVLQRSEEIAEIISQETGKSVPEVLLNEISGINEYAKVAIKEAEATLGPAKVSISRVAYPGKKAVVESVPRGVVGIIAPWNYPFSIFFKPLFPALLAGNAVVLKPSEFTPRTGAWLADRFTEVLGEGLVSVVQGAGDVGAALLESGIDAVTFTGSVATGRKVAARAGELLIPHSVELGGKDAAIVLADCNFERTLAGITQWALHNCGQNCGAIERLYIEESIADDFVSRLAALFEKVRVAPEFEYCEIGPLQNPAQLKTVERHIDDALKKGAELLAGGDRCNGGQGLGFRPTLLDHCTDEMDVVREETFGPVIAVLRVDDEEEAIRRANASNYGLNGSVWTTDLNRGKAIARRLDVGIALVNNHAIPGSMANIPWTGTGDTGTGIAASRYSYPTFVRRQTIFVDSSRGPDPWWFPFNEDTRELSETLIEFSLGSVFSAIKLAGIAKRRVKAIREWVSESGS